MQCALVTVVVAFAAKTVDAKCKAPREGVWTIEVYEPRQSSGEFTPKIDFEAPTNVGKAQLRRHHADPNIYTGHCVLGADGPATPLNRMDYNFIWDDELCELYGSATFPYILFFAHLQWKVHDDVIYGYYEVMFQGYIPFPFTSLHVLRYAGPTDDYAPF